MYFDTNDLEVFAKKFSDRLIDRRICYYLKKDDNGYKANAVHSSIIWSREVIEELNRREYNKMRELHTSDLLLLIFYVDILLEATDQIYRVLYNTSETEKLSENEIFVNKPESYSKLDDRGYFKELRAIFGAHPVNLREPDNHKARFADIPMKPNLCIQFKNYPPIKGEYDFYERLWTSTRNDYDTIFMPLKVSEVLEFANVLVGRFELFTERLRIIAYHKDKL